MLLSLTSSPWVSWRGGSLPVPWLPFVFLTTLAPVQEFLTLRCNVTYFAGAGSGGGGRLIWWCRNFFSSSRLLRKFLTLSKTLFCNWLKLFSVQFYNHIFHTCWLEKVMRYLFTSEICWEIPLSWKIKACTDIKNSCLSCTWGEVEISGKCVGKVWQSCARVWKLSQLRLSIALRCNLCTRNPYGLQKVWTMRWLNKIIKN